MVYWGILLNPGYAQNACPTHLEDMSNSIFSVDLLFHNTVLVYADRGQKIQDGLVHGLETIDNQSDGDPLPTGATFLRGPPPVFGLLRLADIADVQHDAMKSTGVQGLVFVIRCNSDQDIGMPSPQFLTEGPSVRFGEIIWIVRRGCVPHVPKRAFGVTDSLKRWRCVADEMTYENSVVLVPEYLASMAL